MDGILGNVIERDGARPLYLQVANLIQERIEAGDLLPDRPIPSEKQLVQEFDGAGGSGKPRYGQVTVCYAESEEEAKKTALEIWPNGGMSGPIGQELAIPSHYEAVAELLTADQVAETVICGPDPQRHAEAIREYEQAGFDHVWVHQVGRDQESFLRFYAEQVLPEL